MRRLTRRHGLMDSYKAAMGDVCCWPGCFKGGQDVHHIVPFSRGGLDEVQNYIVLCQFHHRGRGLHSDFESREVELATYKCLAELERFGFSIDTSEALREAHRDELIAPGAA